MSKRASKKTPVRETVIEAYLKNKVELAGGLCFKWTSPGTIGVPDRIVVLNGNIVFVELKRPGGKPRPSQLDIHRRLALRGVGVLIIDSKEQCNELVAELKKNKGKGGW